MIFFAVFFAKLISNPKKIPAFIKNAVMILLLTFPLLSGCSSRGNDIDLSRVIFSTYLGGSTPCREDLAPITFGQNTACDQWGNVYVTGATQVSDLPVKSAWQWTPAENSTMSAFVAKYSGGGRLIWCTYLGGNNQSMGIGVAAMPDGGVAVSGKTSSDADGPFPLKNAYQEDYHGNIDYFVSVFDSAGSLRYSTYLGGEDNEGWPAQLFTDDSNNGNNIAADSQGLIYLTGVTDSGEGVKFPVTPNALQPELAGDTDAVFCVIDPAKSGEGSLVYSSFLGGEKNEKGHGIAVSPQGDRIILSGYTKSDDFPTTANAFRRHHPPAGWTSNGFLVNFAPGLPGDPSPYQMLYSTYLGADNAVARDEAYAVALDKNGVAYVTGRTQSPDFPMTGGDIPSIYNSAPYLQPEVSGDEPYLVKIDPALEGADSLVYSSYTGGGEPDGSDGGTFCSGMAVDHYGNAYLAGETSALGQQYVYSKDPQEAPQKFPYTLNAEFTALQGEYDAVFIQVNPRGTALKYSSFFGGSKNDRAYGMATDPYGNIAISGLTFSQNFPLRHPAQTYPPNTTRNAFIAKFAR